MLKTTTLAKFPEISLEKLLYEIHKIEYEYPMRVKRLKCSPEAYIALKDFFLQEEHEEEMRKAVVNENRQSRGLDPLPEINNWWGTLYGIDIVLDPSQKAGEMEFE